LSELRSLTYQQVPVIALTATATFETRNNVIDTLSMYEPIVISDTPDRNNIKFYVVQLKCTRENFLMPVISSLKTLKNKCDKVLIFCRKMTDVRRLFRVFERHLINSYEGGYLGRPFAMYHAKTEENIKNHVSIEFKKSDGSVRVLIATIAFGMGVNCQGLYQIIHFGPPATLDDYFQEAGRAGRDGLQSYAVMVNYPTCLSSKNISSSMKGYIKNNDICRRQLILQSFGQPNEQLQMKHLCCDICQISCRCHLCYTLSNSANASESSDSIKWWEIIVDEESNSKSVSSLPSATKKVLEEKLNEM